MRNKLALWLAAMALAVGVSVSSPAIAGDLSRSSSAHGHDPVVHHRVYFPKYRHVYHVADTSQSDPYAWNYSPRGYYPFYASQYWVPAEQMRYRYRYKFTGQKFRYHAAWGYPKKDYNHREWHGENHGFHHRWHW
jgi:hypothetical protein